MIPNYSDKTVEKWDRRYQMRQRVFNKAIQEVEDELLKDIFIQIWSLFNQVRIHLNCIALEMHKHSEEDDDDEA